MLVIALFGRNFPLCLSTDGPILTFVPTTYYAMNLLANLLGARAYRRTVRGTARPATFRGTATIGQPLDEGFARVAASCTNPLITFSVSR